MKRILPFLFLTCVLFAPHVSARIDLSDQAIAHPESIQSSITIHIARAIRDDDVVKISGRVESPESPVHSLMIEGQEIIVEDGRFATEVSALDALTMTAVNELGESDQLTIQFSDAAPERGVALKINQYGLEQVASGITELLQEGHEEVGGLVNGIIGGINIDLKILKISFSEPNTVLSDDSELDVWPNQNDEQLELGLSALVNEIILQTGINLQLCLIGCFDPWVIPLNMTLEGLTLGGGIMLAQGEPNESGKTPLLSLDSDLNVDLAGSQVYLFDSENESKLLGSIVTLLLKSQVNSMISGLIENEVGNILTTIPSSIPGLLVDNDNGVSELLDGIGILPLFKMLVRGIGLTFGVSDAYTDGSQGVLVLDLNLTTETADSYVKFGYITREAPLSMTELAEIAVSDNVSEIGTFFIDADVLNITFSVFNQASLLDLQLGSMDVDELIVEFGLENVADELVGKTIHYRFYSRNGVPYFKTPSSEDDLLALELNDYALQLIVDDEPLLEVFMDMVINANAGIYNSRFYFSELHTEYQVNGASWKEQPVAIEEILPLVDALHGLVATKVMGVASAVPLPEANNTPIVSVNSWRPNLNSADIAFSLAIPSQTENNEEVAQAAHNWQALLAGEETASDSVLEGELTDEDIAGMDPDSNASPDIGVDIELPQVLVDLIRDIGSLFTEIGGEPNDLPSNIAEVDLGDPNGNQPEVPAINRETIAIKNGHFTRSRASDVRLTRDGRLGVSAFGLTLTLMKPEQVDQPFVASDEVQLLTDQEFNVFEVFQQSEYFAGEIVGSGSSAICDPDPTTVKGGKRENPYVCGEGGKDDCYDVSILYSQNLESDTTFSDLLPVLDRPQIQVSNSRLVSVPVTVRIENPKSPEAHIADVQVQGDPIYSDEFSGILFEMSVPYDGRLFITRISGRALTWYNENKDLYVNDAYDAVYAVIPEEADACDVSQFSGFRPLSHAPYDASMKRYKFAAYPFRDPMGNVFADGAELKGTYPWVSMDGSMLSLTTIGISRLFPRHHIDGNPMTRYPSRCLDDEPECDINTRADVQFRSLDSGFVLFGLWTHGKMVLVDNLINESDFKLGNFGGDKEHSLVSLYQPGTGKHGDESGEVEVGETREATTRDEEGNKNSYGTALGNGTIFDSITNRLNFWDNMQAIIQRDVVWNVSSGRQTDEMSFDDELNPDGFIISNMVGAMDATNSNDIAMEYFDGWNQADLDFTNHVRVQNSATALPYNWQIPKYGQVHFGRLEPTATGGVTGKGLWLDGESIYLSYDIAEQPQNIATKPWFTSLFIDPRFENDGVERLLVQFPDQSELILVGLDSLVYRDQLGQTVHQVTIPETLNAIDWTHLALQVMPGGKRVLLYLNGFLLDSWQSTSPMFQYSAGKLSIGGLASSNETSPAAFRGWIDEFKVIAQGTSPEVVCNQAKGTLVGLADTYEGELNQQADQYPARSHQFLTRILTGYGQTSFPRYACFHDYSDDYAAHLKNIPEGVVAVREAFIFPEGPLYHDKPRPDSLNNNFCLSCHHENGQGGLGLDALKRDLETLAKHDLRRQPSQAPGKVGGYIPADWLPGMNNSEMTLPEAGIPFDELLLDSAAEITPTLTGVTLVNAATGLDIMPITDGITLDRAQLPAQLAIRIVANGVTESVTVEWNGNAQTLASPYSLFGVEWNARGTRSFSAGELGAGSYQLTAQADGGTGEGISMTFGVVGNALANGGVGESNPPDTENDPDLWDAMLDFFASLFAAIAA